MKKILLALLFSLALALPVCAAEESALCTDEGCEAAIAPVKFHNWEAWRLTDGVTEAIVVPAIGRMMSFKRVGGKEWLWTITDPEKVPAYGDWKNWGGEKTWLSPQDGWGALGTNNGWPPAKEWDQIPYTAEVLSGGKLRLTGAVSPATGARIIREFWHEKGSFMVKQTLEKLRGEPVTCGLWNVSQISGVDVGGVILARKGKSDYANGFRWISGEGHVTPQTTGDFIKVVPGLSGAYKIGVDTTRAFIAAQRGDEVLSLEASVPSGDYPDGEPGKKGTPIQLYGQGSEKLHYLELEFLAPLRRCVAGSRWSHTITWKITKVELPS